MFPFKERTYLDHQIAQMMPVINELRILYPEVSAESVFKYLIRTNQKFTINSLEAGFWRFDSDREWAKQELIKQMLES